MKIKEGDTISYKEIVSFLLSEFPGEGFDNDTTLNLINEIPNNKKIIKEKLLKLSKLKIRRPVEIDCYSDSQYVYVTFLDFKKRTCISLDFYESYVYVNMFTKVVKK